MVNLEQGHHTLWAQILKGIKCKDGRFNGRGWEEKRNTQLITSIVFVSRLNFQVQGSERCWYIWERFCGLIWQKLKGCHIKLMRTDHPFWSGYYRCENVIRLKFKIGFHMKVHINNKSSIFMKNNMKIIIYSTHYVTT